MTTHAPNVLLIVFDTARADALEPYGAPAGTSPTVAQLASTGSAAPVAYATSSWTVPSHASLFTGLLPGSVGLGRGVDATPQSFASAMHAHRERSLPTVLGRNGFETAGVSANLWVSAESGFDAGFDRFSLVGPSRTAKMGDGSWKGRLRWALEALRARCDDGAAAVEQMLDEWLTGRGYRPFFWFVNLVECHSPYLPPKPFNDLGPIARLRATADVQAHETFRAFTHASLGGFDVDEAALARMHHLYMRSVQMMDTWLARVLDALDRRGVLDDTVVLVTSDHGENFGECRLMGHSFSLDDRLIRIPMVAAGPASIDFGAVTSLADVPALVAGAVGLDEHPWTARGDAGVAVAELDAMCGPDDEIGHESIAELGLGAEAHRRLVTPLVCATDGAVKLLRRGDREEVYDLRADPLESEPTSTVDLAVLDRLRRALDAAALAKVAPIASMANGHDVDLRERMELLGYI